MKSVHKTFCLAQNMPEIANLHLLPARVWFLSEFLHLVCTVFPCIPDTYQTTFPSCSSAMSLLSALLARRQQKARKELLNPGKGNSLVLEEYKLELRKFFQDKRGSAPKLYST